MLSPPDSQVLCKLESVLMREAPQTHQHVSQFLVAADPAAQPLGHLCLILGQGEARVQQHYGAKILSCEVNDTVHVDNAMQ